MTQLVRLVTRPSRDGKRYTYCLDYIDENGKRVRKSLGHADKRKAERQRAQFERELRMGTVAPRSLKLKEFIKDSLRRTRGQIRASSIKEYDICYQDFVRVIGNVDFQSITLRHGERYIQQCLDRGNSPATAAKKVRHLKRLFQLGVERGQREDNPFRFLKPPRCPNKDVRVLTDAECLRLVEAAKRLQDPYSLDWAVLLQLTLYTGLRKGEALNLIWQNIDFAGKTVQVAPKSETEHTWEWHIKDSERRLLPIPDAMVNMLAQHQLAQVDGNPYVFVPTWRYRFIQKLRQAGRWDVIKGKNPLNNFDRQRKAIMKEAGISDMSFHDLRRTCLTNWFKGGLREFDVMRMAGHSSFDTTRKFYMGIDRDLLERTRKVNAAVIEPIFGTHLARAPETT